MTEREYVIKASYGNDSLALIQWMHEEGHSARCYVVHNDTGWMRKSWAEVMAPRVEYARSLGMETVTIESMGFVAASRLKQAFPRSGMQFCTTMLKIEPTLVWLDQVDPDKELIGVVGVRREEGEKSQTRRATWPEWVEESELDGGRSLWSPLVRVREPERDVLIRRAGFEPLPHRSQECFPCVNSSRADLRRLAEDPDRVAVIRDLEAELSEGKDKKRRMFRRQSGIDETIRWAQSSRGDYVEGQAFLFGCDAGFCGT